jgi:hypothetical protein
MDVGPRGSLRRRTPTPLRHARQRTRCTSRKPAAGPGACHQLRTNPRAPKALGIPQELTPQDPSYKVIALSSSVLQRIATQGEHKANMLELPGYGAAARVSCESDDPRGTQGTEALAVATQTSHGSRRLHRAAGELPAARRNAATAANDAATGDTVENSVATARIMEEESV